jgi:hypothetical protein
VRSSSLFLLDFSFLYFFFFFSSFVLLWLCVIQCIVCWFVNLSFIFFSFLFFVSAQTDAHDEVKQEHKQPSSSVHNVDNASEISVLSIISLSCRFSSPLSNVISYSYATSIRCK